MEGSCETGISHLRGEKMYVSTSEAPMISKLLKLAEENADDVTIIKRPEDNDGCLYVTMPFSYLKIGVPRRLNLSDEERQLRIERIKKARETRLQPTL